jgi:hypothetical protein
VVLLTAAVFGRVVRRGGINGRVPLAGLSVAYLVGDSTQAIVIQRHPFAELAEYRFETLWIGRMYRVAHIRTYRTITAGAN